MTIGNIHKQIRRAYSQECIQGPCIFPGIGSNQTRTTKNAIQVAKRHSISYVYVWMSESTLGIWDKVCNIYALIVEQGGLSWIYSTIMKSWVVLGSSKLCRTTQYQGCTLLTFFWNSSIWPCRGCVMKGPDNKLRSLSSCIIFCGHGLSWSMYVHTGMNWKWMSSVRSSQAEFDDLSRMFEFRDPSLDVKDIGEVRLYDDKSMKTDLQKIGLVDKKVSE